MLFNCTALYRLSVLYCLQLLWTALPSNHREDFIPPRCLLQLNFLLTKFWSFCRWSSFLHLFNREVRQHSRITARLICRTTLHSPFAVWLSWWWECAHTHTLVWQALLTENCAMIMICIEVRWSPSPEAHPYRNIMQGTTTLNYRLSCCESILWGEDVKYCWSLLPGTELLMDAMNYKLFLLVLTCFLFEKSTLVVCIMCFCDCCLTHVIADLTVCSAGIPGNLQNELTLIQFSPFSFDCTVWFSWKQPHRWGGHWQVSLREMDYCCHATLAVHKCTCSC